MSVRSWRTRAALGLPPALLPITAYLAVGYALGPRALNVISEDVRAHLDAVISVALGTLGVVAGLALAPAARQWRALAAASIESCMTLLVVGAAFAALLVAWRAPVTAGAWPLAILLGAAAAASGSRVAAGGDGPALGASDFADLDDVVPIAAAAVVVPASAAAGVRFEGLPISIAIGLAVALIGSLVFTRAAATGERAVFVLGTLTLLGGACAYAGVSPLLAGLVCGVVWRLVPGRADAIIATDLRKFHHPLLLLLLIEAGTQVTPSLLAIWMFGALLVFRLAGKVAGSCAAARVCGEPAAGLAVDLLSPGVMGIAVTRNFLQVSPGDGVAMLSAVAAAVVGFELLAALVQGEGRS